MVEGFWIVQYEGVQGYGGGVAVLIKGHILGGDTGFLYTGTYQTDEVTLSARIMVRNFLPEVPNVLGVAGDFELLMKGDIAGQTIRGSATLIGQEGAGIDIANKRLCLATIPASHP
jgi:hypothetical protein